MTCKKIIPLLFVFIVSLGHIAEAQCGLFCKYSGPSSMRPYGLAISKDNTMFIVGGDTAAIGINGFLSKAAPDGREKRFVELKSRFIGPGIDFDNEGNIFLACGECILRISKAGNVDTLLSNFKGAFDLRLDRKGNIYVADHREDKIYKVTPSRQRTVFADNHPTSQNEFMLGGLSFDKDCKYLYSVEPLTRTLRRYLIEPDGDPDKPVVILSGGPIFYTFDVDDSGTVIAVDFEKKEIVSIALDGQLKCLAINTGLKDPLGLRLVRHGFNSRSVFIADIDGVQECDVSTSH